MRFKYWKRTGGKSPPLNYIKKVMIQNITRDAKESDEEQIDILDILEVIEKAGFEKSLKAREFKPITNKNKEPLYQINKGRHRLVFVKRENIGWICDAFLKKSKPDEQKHYNLVRKRAKEID